MNTQLYTPSRPSSQESYTTYEGHSVTGMERQSDNLHTHTVTLYCNVHLHMYQDWCIVMDGWMDGWMDG